VPGVLKVVSGYTAGTGGKIRPMKRTHVKAQRGVQIFYESSEVGYAQLLDVILAAYRSHGCRGILLRQRGSLPEPIFYHDEEQRRLAENPKRTWKIREIFQAIVTEIIKFNRFYDAEEYHQDYYKNNPSV